MSTRPWSHRGTVNKLREVGIPLVPHRAKQISLADYNKFDYIIGMDTANIRNLNRMLKGDPEGKVYKFLSFAGLGSFLYNTNIGNSKKGG